ncbi:hypothetical protein ACLQ2R_17115 [Streptosporangium sp. DT93]|uniref:hypothetical protein n=1 Tax=Streptosporangium sp. DT93 TaxID=3393428 RepID=UPI003CF323D2
MIAIVFGGLLATAVFLYPALQLKRRGKWSIIMGLLMLLAGLGLVGITLWLTRLLTGSVPLALIVGGIALVLLAGFVVAMIADISDGRVDKPWFIFMLPSLVAVVLLTGSQTISYVGTQIESNVSTISSQMGAR